MSGKAWDRAHGFFNKQFSYSSGLVNTGHCFKQKYGRFEAKILFNEPTEVTHTFWMVAEKQIPHIDVVKFDKKINFDHFYKNGDGNAHRAGQQTAAKRYAGKPYIFTLLWSANSLEWLINGVSVTKITEHVPQEPMYVAFSSGVYGNSEPEISEQSFLIEWVRCYQMAESV
ncbi:MAG: glycoside hydrolase family 16 protein [Bacteroidales bacterium]|nr:glycoside hydrolase family 16 protein [Bacteroidales bacterium]